MLHLHFPDAWGPRLGAALEALEAETGWSVSVHPQPHQGELSRAALEATRRAAGPGAVIEGGASLRLDERSVVVRVSPPPPAEAAADFAAATGWSLRWRPAKAAAGVGPLAAPASLMDPQACRVHVRRLFAEVEAIHRPLKVKYPGSALRLHFIHPGMAARHRGRVAALAEATGRAVEIHPHPVHQRLVELAAGMVPPGWAITGQPAYVPGEDVLRIPAWSEPPEAEVEALVAAIRDRLGCRARVEVRDA